MRPTNQINEKGTERGLRPVAPFQGSPRPRPDTTSPSLYPAFLDLRERPVLLVGGGAVALQKARELLRAAARVRAVAPAWTNEFEALAADDHLSRETRHFLRSDLDGAFLVIAATDDPTVQRAVWEGAEARGILCNVADVPELCSFQVPASLRRGSLTVAVSSAGKSPRLAVALRDRLAAAVHPALATNLETLAEARAMVRRAHPNDPAARKEELEALLTPEALEEILSGRQASFEARYRSWRAGLELKIVSDDAGGLTSVLKGRRA